jgi:general secretion pathway protein G
VLTALLLCVLLALSSINFGPVTLGRQRKGQRGAAATQLGAFRAALLLYRGDQSRFPSTAQGLQALISRPARLPHPDRWKRYLTDTTSVPPDPWGGHYVYQSPGPAGEAFRVTCYGADGVRGGSGDDADLIATEAFEPSMAVPAPPQGTSR